MLGRLPFQDSQSGAATERQSGKASKRYVDVVMIGSKGSHAGNETDAALVA